MLVSVGMVLLLLGLLGGLPLLLVTVLDGPATGRSSVTLQMLASQMGVCIFGGGE